MNTQIQEFQFDGIAVAIIDHNGEGWITGDDIGQALEYSEPRDSISKIFERNREVLEEYSTTVKLTAVDGKERDTRVYNEEGVIIIGFLSKQPKAIAFQKSAAKILKAYRHKNLPAQDNQHLLNQLNEANQQLIDSQHTNIKYLQEQLDSSQKALNGAMRLIEDEMDKVKRLKRARGKVSWLERQEIFDRHENGHDVAQLADWSGRSRAMIKKILAGGRHG